MLNVSYWTYFCFKIDWFPTLMLQYFYLCKNEYKSVWFIFSCLLSGKPNEKISIPQNSIVENIILPLDTNDLPDAQEPLWSCFEKYQISWSIFLRLLVPTPWSLDKSLCWKHKRMGFLLAYHVQSALSCRNWWSTKKKHHCFENKGSTAKEKHCTCEWSW